MINTVHGMTLLKRFEQIQLMLNHHNIDAWMMYDFRGSNSIAQKICDVSPRAHCTRKWAVIVPRNGEVVKIVNAIEAHTLAHVPATELRYAERSTWIQSIQSVLPENGTIAMEYSPMGALPVVSKVDAGTVEWLRSMGMRVVSSADMAQELQAVWTSKQRSDNEKTSFIVRAAMMDAMHFLGEKIRKNQFVTEYDVQQNIVRFFEQNDVVTDHDPIVAIGVNAANPHYAPTVQVNSAIGSNQLVLIDMWAKGSADDATYADITWMCHTGSAPSAREREIFNVVRDARNAAFNLVCERFSQGENLRGYEVDDAARNVITTAGFGEYFIHRTGHNIGEETHGSGANMDNYETHDDRSVLPGTSFSIEPGIYIPGEIGVRSEISVVIDESGRVHVPSQPVQEEIVCLG